MGGKQPKSSIMRVLIFQYLEQLDELTLGGLLSFGIVGASGDQNLREAAG